MSSQIPVSRHHMPWLISILLGEVLLFGRVGLPYRIPHQIHLPFNPEDPAIQRRARYDPRRDPLLGQMAPVLSIRSLDGKKITLGRPSDQPTVVVFASDCSSCGGGATVLQWDALQRGHPTAHIFIASQEKAAGIRGVLAGRDLKVHILLDTTGQAARAYNALWHPRAYLIDRQGRVRYVEPDTRTEVDAIRDVSQLIEAHRPPATTGAVASLTPASRPLVAAGGPMPGP